MPATDPAMIRKALAAGADQVVIDLEDAVLPKDKQRARDQLAQVLVPTAGAVPVAVRVNALGTEWFADDVAAVARLSRVTSLILPKVESPADVAAVVAAIDAGAGPTGRTLTIEVLVESARGLTQADEIASASPRLTSMILGYADLAVSLGRSLAQTPDEWWNPAREAFLWAARSAGLHAIDGPYLGVDVDDPFRSRITALRDRGFDGTWVIHPRQIAVVHEGLAVSNHDLTRAAALVRTYESGHTGSYQADGRMIDEAVVSFARRTLARSATVGTSS